MLRVLIILLLSYVYLFSSTYEIGKSQDIYLSVYKDINSSLDISDVRALKAEKFKRLTTLTDTNFFSNASFWYKLKIKNNSSKIKEQLLMLSVPWLDNVTFYIYDQDGNEFISKQGDREAFHVRTLPHVNINISHFFEVGESTLYFKVHTRDPVVVQLYISSLEDFYKGDIQKAALRGLFFGIIFAMIIYNLILFLSVRNRIYSSYVLYLSFFLLMVLSYNGYLYQYIWPNSPEVNNDAISIFMTLYMIFGIIFAQNFLDLKKKHKTLFEISKQVIYALIGITTALYIYGSYQYLIAGSIIMAVLFGLFIFYLGIIAWLNNNHWAVYFLVATSAGSIGTLTTALSIMSIIPFSNLAYRGVELGIVIDSLLLSLALAERMRITQDEKIEVERERNEEIQKNKLKDKHILAQSRMAQMGEMISIIAHQWRQPLGAVSAVSANLKVKLELGVLSFNSPSEKEESFMYMLDKLDKINEYVKNLTLTIDDFRNFYKPNRDKRVVSLAEIIEKTLSVIEDSLQSDNIEVICKYDDKIPLEVYDHELMQVILNILKNSKDNFLDKGIENPQIIILATKNSIEICDNGGGIDESILENIFDPYYSTKNEKNGTGLGLYMSKMIVEDHHNGILSVENIADGVCFKISL